MAGTALLLITTLALATSPAGLFIGPANSILDGYINVYNFDYNHTTTSAEISAIKSSYPSNYYIAFVARSATTFYMACIDTIAIALQTTISYTTAHAGSVSGLYWYWYDGNSIGCAPEQEVSLGSADTRKNGVDYRISWHLGSAGGYRYGIFVSNTATNIFKQIYILPSCHPLCNGCSIVNSNSSCLSCTVGNGISALIGGTTCDCLVGYYYMNILSQCVKCHPLCAHCLNDSSINCTECTSGPHIDSISGTVCRCQLGYYYKDSTDLCAKCDPLCASCYGPSSSECDSCIQQTGITPAPIGTTCS